MNLLPSNIINAEAAIVQPIDSSILAEYNIGVDVLRLDKIHPVISGNKWFKLKYYLQEALEKKYKKIITFGGAYSNHIVATAFAAKSLGLQSIGVIRGEKPATLSHTLQAALHYGMQLEFVSRETYQQKNKNTFINALSLKHTDAYFIAEGGEGDLGVKGAGEIMELVDKQKYTYILCAVGTGTLLKGLATTCLPQQQIIGIPVLKGFDNWLQAQPFFHPYIVQQRVHLINDYHFGGYAKKNNVLIDFMNDLYKKTGLPTDFVYTGKLLFAALDLINKKYFFEPCNLLIIHSGGLQGNLSLPLNYLFF